MYQHTIEINQYKGWLILTLLNKGPKIKDTGIGLMFSNFNSNDLLISKSALDILISKINTQYKDPVLEIVRPDCIWWSSKQGIIIPADEQFNVFTLPLYTIKENTVDPQIALVIDKKTQI